MEPRADHARVEAAGAGTDTTEGLLLDRLFASAPVGLAVVDRSYRYLRVNPVLAAINGRLVEDHIGRTPSQILGELGSQVELLLERVMSTGEPMLDLDFTLPDGRHLVGAYAPVSTDEGDIIGLVAVVQDVTERRRVEIDLARALDHSTHLHLVASGLSAALTVDEVAGVIVRTSMDAVGANCGVLARRVGGTLEIEHRYGIAGRPPSSLPLSADLPMPLAARERRPVLLGSRDEWLMRFPQTPPTGDFAAFAAIPIVYEGRATGCMGLGLGDQRVLDDREVAMLSAIGRMGAAALERAYLYEERAYVAATLQEGLMPRALPQLQGIEVAFSYRPLGDGSEVGGDFYDVVDLGEGGALAAVGDVCGKGAKAAVLSGLVRATIASVAQRGDRPADILALADRAITRHGGERSDYATAVCAVLSPTPDGLTATIGNAGHPPALVVRASGEVETVAGGGAMLGIGQSVPVAEHDVTLAPGDVLLLHTDGVTDGRSGDERFGEERLHAVLRDATGAGPRELVDAVRAAMKAFEVGPPPDDAAMLAVAPR